MTRLCPFSPDGVVYNHVFQEAVWNYRVWSFPYRVVYASCGKKSLRLLLFKIIYFTQLKLFEVLRNDVCK